MRAWLNGSLLDDAETPALSVLDHGFTVGDGVFEAVKLVQGRPFALSRHVRRLAASAEGLGLPVLDEDAVRRGVAAVLEAEHIDLGRVRITYTAGVSPLGSARLQGEPTLVVVADHMAPSAASAAIVVVPWPRNEHGAVVGLKTTSYAENVVALAHAQERGASEAVFANTAGDLCEGTGSNVFYAIDGQLRTPSLASGCLAGITRGLLLEWVDVTEVDEPVSVLERADEIFLASTTRDVQPVHRCGERELTGPGPLTAEAAQVWREREREDVDP